jgi:hypothetical protein
VRCIGPQDYYFNADLSDANLTGARKWPKGQLRQAKSLRDATMPNGQKYEDCLKDEESRSQYPTEDQKTYADLSKWAESSGWPLPASQKTCLAWLKDREGGAE